MVTTGIKADDWMVVAALVFATGYLTSIFLCMLKYGGGRHEILLTNPIKFAQCVLAAEVFYATAIASVNISTLLLFSRIFPGHRFRLLLWLVGIFVTTYTGLQLLVIIFQCRPIQGAWDPTVEAKCVENLVVMIMGGMNVLTDLILVCAPLPTIWGLHLETKVKLQLMGIFCVGVFICIVSIYRIHELHGLSLADAPWSDVDATIWSTVEVCVAIACSCAITYRPLFNRVFGLHVSAVASEPSGQSSKPSPDDNSYPRAHERGWEDIDANAYQMKAIPTVEEVSVEVSRKPTKAKGWKWDYMVSNEGREGLERFEYEERASDRFESDLASHSVVGAGCSCADYQGISGDPEADLHVQ